MQYCFCPIITLQMWQDTILVATTGTIHTYQKLGPRGANLCLRTTSTHLAANQGINQCCSKPTVQYHHAARINHVLVSVVCLLAHQRKASNASIDELLLFANMLER